MDIKTFFTLFPAVSKSQFCREAGISTRSLYFYIDGSRNPSTKTQQRLIKTMTRYGYKGL
jgi:predicted transcriptional regulator